MKHFILSAFSVVLVAAAVTPSTQALPKVDPTLNIQTLRLREFDARNKSEENSQPDYPQPSTDSSSQDTYAERESTQTAEPTAWESLENVWEKPKKQKEGFSPAPSLTQRRHQSLDRS